MRGTAAVSRDDTAQTFDGHIREIGCGDLVANQNRLFRKINISALLEHPFTQHAQAEITNIIGTLGEVAILHLGKDISMLFDCISPAGWSPVTRSDTFLSVIDQ